MIYGAEISVPHMMDIYFPSPLGSCSKVFVGAEQTRRSRELSHVRRTIDGKIHCSSAGERYARRQVITKAAVNSSPVVADSPAASQVRPAPQPSADHQKASTPGSILPPPEAKSETAGTAAMPAKNNALEGFLGASSGEKKGERHDGVRIDGVSPGGPADQAGLKAGDYILSIDNHYLFTVEDLDSEVRSHKPGTRVAVRYRRYSAIDETFVIIGGDAPTK
jgi:membrane-associated protease RseP (regulator of RpoE activity)